MKTVTTELGEAIWKQSRHYRAGRGDMRTVTTELGEAIHENSHYIAGRGDMRTVTTELGELCVSHHRRKESALEPGGFPATW